MPPEGSDCLFCSLVRDGEHVNRADGFVAIRDIAPQAPTHLLVLTDRAFRRLLKDLPSIQLKVLTALAERLPAEAF